MTPVFLLWPAQQAFEAGPSVSTVAVAFAGVCALWLVKVTVESRDQSRSTHQTLHTPKTGIVDRIEAIAAQLDAHCNDERVFWDEVTEGREAIVNRATVVVSQSESRLTDRIDGLATQVKILAERREKAR